MRINTNITALNSYNQLQDTQNKLSQSLERLSSGKRINSAADDAAGLAISEKMTSQTEGLAQAQRNAQDGISMLQTAEGALKESHSILQRMRELSVQSANDTNTQADREEIQKEVDQLSKELTRISNTTEFNTQKLVNGAVKSDGKGEATLQIGANEDQNIDISLNAMDAESLDVAADGEISSTIEGTADSTNSGSINVEVKDSDGNTVNTGTVNVTSGDGGSTVSSQFSGVSNVTSNWDSTNNELTVSATNDYQTVEITGGDTGTLEYAGVEAGDSATNSTSADFDTNGDLNHEAIAGAGIDVSTQSNANDAIETIDSAIQDVSAERSKIGATQNRLEHTINNLNTSQENITAAESRISDVDMAKEMMNMSKQQILSQAGTAMMAQANQLPQGVLQLLG